MPHIPNTCDSPAQALLRILLLLLLSNQPLDTSTQHIRGSGNELWKSRRLMLALLLVNRADFHFVLSEQLAAAVILRCVADRITNTTQKCMH